MLDDTNLTLSDPRIVSAMIGAAVVALGWFISGFRERLRVRTQRGERVSDVQRALFAEVRAYIEVLKRDNLDAYEQAMIARMEADAKFIPLIPTEDNDTIFRSIVADIHVLPRSSIDPIVLYYSQLNAISAIISDLRSKAYAELSVSRRIAMYRDYISLKREAIDLGDYALDMLTAYAKGGEAEVARAQQEARKSDVNLMKTDVQAWLNSRGVDRSDQ